MLTYIFYAKSGTAKSTAENLYVDTTNNPNPTDEKGLWCYGITHSKPVKMFFRGEAISTIVTYGRGWYEVSPRKALAYDLIVTWRGKRNAAVELHSIDLRNKSPQKKSVEMKEDQVRIQRVAIIPKDSDDPYITPAEMHYNMLNQEDSSYDVPPDTASDMITG